MPIAPGTRLGPYEILAPIGAGGMGEVYKATDTRLDRIVAIKVSNERFSERFEREARAVAATVLRELEQTTKTRMRDFIISARTLLEGNPAESIEAVGRIVASDFRDPEGLFYLSRHLAHLNEVGPALNLFERVVAGGYFCFPAMARDPWLDPLRKKPAFTELLHQAETQHREAAAAFAQLRGEKVLGIASPS